MKIEWRPLKNAKASGASKKERIVTSWEVSQHTVWQTLPPKLQWTDCDTKAAFEQEAYAKG
jgi:hypothetical protein